MFTDWRCNTRRKARDFQAEIRGTGGGEPKVKPLTQLEERLLSLTGRVVVDGIQAVPETGVTSQVTLNQLSIYQTGYGMCIHYW